MEMVSEWKKISDENPPRDRTILISWDSGCWVKAYISRSDIVTIDWLGEKVAYPLDYLRNRYWFYVPLPPDGDIN